MHTLKVTVAGLVLLAGCLLIGRILGAATPPWTRMMARSARAFLVIWFIWSGVNMYLRVTDAGYPVADEALHFLVLYGVPAAVALLVIRRLGKAGA